MKVVCFDLKTEKKNFFLIEMISTVRFLHDRFGPSDRDLTFKTFSKPYIKKG